MQSCRMILKLAVFISCVAVAAGATACPIDNFIGNWSGSCSQTVGMKAACATADACTAAGAAGLGLAYGYDTTTTGGSPCTQEYTFSYYKVGTVIYNEYTSGKLIGTCSNAVSPNSAMFAFLQRAINTQVSFSVNDNDKIQTWFGAAAPCYIVSGSSAPTASTAATFLASATADGTYREYGNYDNTISYISPGDATKNPNTYTTTLASAADWTMLGKLYSDAAISARPTGSSPLTASGGLITTTSSDASFSYKCSAKKIIVSTNNKSSGSTTSATASLIALAAFVFAVLL